MEPVFFLGVVISAVFLHFVFEVILDHIRENRRKESLALVRPAELKVVEPVTERNITQADDETFHVTLARDEDEYEYKVARWWNTNAPLGSGREHNNDEINKLFADGWEPFLAGGTACGKWGVADVTFTTLVLRRKKVAE